MTFVIRLLIEVDLQRLDGATLAEFVDPLVVGLTRPILWLLWSQAQLASGRSESALKKISGSFGTTLELVLLEHAVAD